MAHLDFTWEEREGRDYEDRPFHEWTYQHASGRILASVAGSHDQRGGFAHTVNFLFQPPPAAAMERGPFIFVDFDSAKHFAESVVGVVAAVISPDGLIPFSPEPNPVAPMLAAFEKMMTLPKVRAVLVPSEDNE